jgi:hypothetical protein
LANLQVGKVGKDVRYALEALAKRVVSKNEFTKIQILPFTLKALANSSPGLRFGNPGKRVERESSQL